MTPKQLTREGMAVLREYDKDFADDVAKIAREMGCKSGVVIFGGEAQREIAEGLKYNEPFSR